MIKITSLMDLHNEYPNTFKLLKELNPEYFEFEDDGEVVVMHFTDPKEGSLRLTIKEVAVMNNPSFLNLYQKGMTPRAKADILAGIKGEFGKEISPR